MTHDKREEAAVAKRRSLKKLTEPTVLRKAREEQFVDDAEMAEILADERLVERLRAGSRDARGRKGRLAGT